MDLGQALFRKYMDGFLDFMLEPLYRHSTFPHEDIISLMECIRSQNFIKVPFEAAFFNKCMNKCVKPPWVGYLFCLILHADELVLSEGPHISVWKAIQFSTQNVRLFNVTIEMHQGNFGVAFKHVKTFSCRMIVILFFVSMLWLIFITVCNAG